MGALVTLRSSVVVHLLRMIVQPPQDPLGPVGQDPDAVRDAACRLVEEEELCQPPPPPETLQPPSGGGSSAGGWVLIVDVLLWLLVIVVVSALIYIGFRYVQGRKGSTHSADDEDDVDPDDDALLGTVVIDRSREPGAWRAEADGHRAAARYRDALRCRYRALVADLARRGLIDEIPGRTTGEERRQLRASAPNALPFFREAADLFDAAWYGHVAVDHADDDRFQQLERDVLSNSARMPHRIPRSYEEASTTGRAASDRGSGG